MTVVAWRDGIMAVDGCAVAGSTVHPNVPKVVVAVDHLGVERCFAMAGCIALGHLAIRNLLEGEQPYCDHQDPERLTSILELHRDGSVEVFDGAVGYRTAGFGAAGSGDEGALAAMHLGHTPLDAVRVAAKVNSGCRPPFTVLEWRGDKLIRKVHSE